MLSDVRKKRKIWVCTIQPAKGILDTTRTPELPPIWMKLGFFTIVIGLHFDVTI